MNEMDSVGVGIVEMSYNCLFYGVVGNAHFHDAFSRKHKAELSHRVLDKLQNITDEEFANLNLEVAE